VSRTAPAWPCRRLRLASSRQRASKQKGFFLFCFWRCRFFSPTPARPS
jgi:hypothetical protein